MRRHLIPRVSIQRQWSEALTKDRGWWDWADGWALVVQWLGIHLAIRISRVGPVRP